jgi:putative ABC transport system permease protein
MISDYVNISLKNLRRRKLRAFLTTIGIVIAIATIFVLISVSLGLESTIKEQFKKLGSDKFFVQPKGAMVGSSNAATLLTHKDVDVIKKISGVRDLTHIIASPTKVSFKDQTRFTNVIALDLETAYIYYETGLAGLDEGRNLEEGDSRKVTVGSQYKGADFFTESVKINDKLIINGYEFRVKGILKSMGNPTDDRQIYMGEDDFREVFNITTRIDAIMVQIESGYDLKEVAAATEKRLIQERGVTKKTADFQLQTPEELLSSFNTVLNIITGFLLGVAAISLIVGAIGIANTMFTSVLERTKEIGIMKAVGARNSAILSLFILESGLLGLIGGIIGVLFGYMTTKIIELIAQNALGSDLFKASSPYSLVIGCLLFAFLTGAISGAAPAYRATKVRPVEALRYE